MKFNNTTSKVMSKLPGLQYMSPAAYLMTIEREELKQIEALKCTPFRAIVLLRDSIKDRANFLIQAGVTA